MIPCMRLLPVVLVAATLAMLTPLDVGHAQSGTNSTTPSAVADSFFHAWARANWKEAAGLLDLETFGMLRDQEVRSMRATRSRRLTAEELMKEVPKMPRAVAEYQAAEFNERAITNDWLSHDYANVPSVDSLAALSVLDAAARWLEARDGAYKFRRALESERTRCSLPDSLFKDMWPASRYRVLGTVETDSLAYALYEEVFNVTKSDSLPASRAARVRRSTCVLDAPSLGAHLASHP